MKVICNAARKGKCECTECIHATPHDMIDACIETCMDEHCVPVEYIAS